MPDASPKCFLASTSTTVTLKFSVPIDNLELDFERAEGLAIKLLKLVGKPIKEKKPRRTPVKPKAEMDDDQYLDWLQEQLAYQHLNVRVINSKLQVWCAQTGNQATRKRLTNWLNREDKPIGNGNGQTQTNGAAQASGGANYGKPSRVSIIRNRDYSVFAEPDTDTDTRQTRGQSETDWRRTG